VGAPKASGSGAIYGVAVMQPDFRNFFRPHILLTAFLIGMIGSSLVRAGDGPPSVNPAVHAIPTASESRSVFNEMFADIGYLARQNDFYAVMGGITLGPIIFRKQFRRESPELTELWAPSPFADKFFESGEIVGDALFPLSLSLAAFGVGTAAGSDQTVSFGSKLLRAEAINGLITITLKASFDRKRPNGGPYSYPSGHSSAAFTAAGVVYGHYGKSLGIPAFIAAGYVGLSRLQENKHYLSDVIAGGLMGSYLGLKISRRRGNVGEQKAKDSNGVKFRLNPAYLPEFKGAEISFGF